MNKLIITKNQRLQEIKESFKSKFPHLKIEFYSEQHEIGKASASRNMYDDNSILGEISTLSNSGELNVDGHLKTSTFETNFFNQFGVAIQFFRKSGNIWLQTTSTDDWTLATQEEKGQEYE